MKLAIPGVTINADDYALFNSGTSVPARAAAKWISPAAPAGRQIKWEKITRRRGLRRLVGDFVGPAIKDKIEKPEPVE